jgi:hypothetical protein
MRVLIIEQASDGGHYLNSVQHLVQAFAPLGCEIVVAVPNTVPESAQFKIYQPFSGPPVAAVSFVYNNAGVT